MVHDEHTQKLKDVITGVNEQFEGEYKVVIYWSRKAVAFCHWNDETQKWQQAIWLWKNLTRKQTISVKLHKAELYRFTHVPACRVSISAPLKVAYGGVGEKGDLTLAAQCASLIEPCPEHAFTLEILA